MVKQEPFEELPEKTEKRISPKKETAIGRKVVIILFLITIILSLLFWLKREIPLFWQKITVPYKMTIEKEGE